MGPVKSPGGSRMRSRQWGLGVGMRFVGNPFKMEWSAGLGKWD